MRAKVEVEEIRKEREALIVTEIPYQVNKATLIEKIAELVREKRIEGISDLRDESDRDGMRIVIEMKRDAVADVVLNQLWRFTAMQSSFAANMIALNGGRPEMLTLRTSSRAFVDFREEVVTRRIKFLLARRAMRPSPGRPRHRRRQYRRSHPPHPHLARCGGGARSTDGAATGRRTTWRRSSRSSPIRATCSRGGTCRLSEAQARGILELRLQRLTALGREEIAEALEKHAAEIADYLDILALALRLFGIIKDELLAVKPRMRRRGGPRFSTATPISRTRISSSAKTWSSSSRHAGYIKRVPLSAYRAQRRGGKGRSGMQTRDEDFVVKPFRRFDAYAGPVLLLARPGL